MVRQQKRNLEHRTLHPALSTLYCALSAVHQVPCATLCTPRTAQHGPCMTPCTEHPASPTHQAPTPLRAPSALHRTPCTEHLARHSPCTERCPRCSQRPLLPSTVRRTARCRGGGTRCGPGAGAHSAPAVPIPPHSPGPPPPPPARSGARRGDVTRTRGRDPRPTAHAPRGRHRGRARLCGGVTRHACARSGGACARDTRVPHGQPLPGRGPQRAPRLPAPCPRRCDR